jgi:hypothetical protein
MISYSDVTDVPVFSSQKIVFRHSGYGHHRYDHFICQFHTDEIMGHRGASNQPDI